MSERPVIDMTIPSAVDPSVVKNHPSNHNPNIKNQNENNNNNQK